jgi:hypothetical protein
MVVGKTSQCSLFIDSEGRCPVRVDNPEAQVHRSEIAISLYKVLQRWRYSSGKPAAGSGVAVQIEERNIGLAELKPGASTPDP